MSSLIFLLPGLWSVLPLVAGFRGSDDYHIVADTVDGGGLAAVSGDYAHHGSVAGIAGVSAPVSLEQVARHGYLGQLYEVTGLEVYPVDPQVGEGGSVQMEARHLIDDATFLAIQPDAVLWSVASGPLLGVDPDGMAVASIVFEDTPASVRGDRDGFTAHGEFLVIDLDPDNFGLYAGDGLPDWWQVAYFGLENPLAGPEVDATGNGQRNLFSYLADLDPLDHGDVFRLRVEPGVPPGEMAVSFAPRRSSRHYIVQQSESLAAPGWQLLTPSAIHDDGDQRTVVDGQAGGPRKFYRVEISLP